MTLWKPHLRELLASQSGIVSLKQTREIGCPVSSRERLLTSGELETVLPGIYRSASWPMGRDQLKVAACLRNPLAALAFTTAGQEWGLRRMHDEKVHVLVPHGSSPELEGIVVHRCRKIDPCDLVERAGGIRITSIARTLFDVGAVVGGFKLESAVEQALDKKLVAFDEIAEAVQRLFHKRRPGSLEIRHVINSRNDWSQAVQSELELRVLRMMRKLGFPEPTIQHSICDLDGRIIRFDFAWPHLKVALEVDHSFWHSGSDESRKDKSRDRRSALLGWQTLRLTEDDVNANLESVLAEILVILRAELTKLGK